VRKLSGQSKIVKWRLEDEVIELDVDGKSDGAIAKMISNKYPDIDELRDISAMSVNRFLVKNREHDVKLRLDEMRDPAQYIHDEFNSKIRENIQDAEKMNNLVNEITLKLQEDKSDISIVELNRIINAWKKTNDQIRINLVALRQFADTQIIKPTQNIIYKKEISVRNLVLDVSRVLCTKCKKEVSTLLEDYSKN